jgi:hypothetical protein
MDAAQCRVAVGHAPHDDTHRPHIEHAIEVEPLALHLLPDAVQVLRPSLNLGSNAAIAQLFGQPLAKGLDVLDPLDALLVEQPGHGLVLLGLQEAERQVLDLPLDLPYAESVGERREHLHRLPGQKLGAPLLAGCVIPQRLQARSQAQQHHTKIACEGQQHLAHALGLLRPLLTLQLRLASGPLDLHQFAGVHDETGVRRPEGFRHGFFGLLQVVTGIDQVRRCTHRRRRADAFEDRADTVGVLQSIFAGVQKLADQQGLRKCPGALNLGHDVALRGDIGPTTIGQ